MIGLLFLAGATLWLMATFMLSRRIPRWVGVTEHAKAVSVLVFPLVLVAPIADDLIARWQFYRLCDREAVVTLSPDWNKVKRARDNGGPMRDLDGYAIPIRVQLIDMIDLDTDMPFLSFKAFHTKGGHLMRHGLGLDGTTSCWPPDWVQVMNRVDSDKLIKQGKIK